MCRLSLRMEQKRMNAIEARMLNHNLTHYLIHCLMWRHHELAAASDVGVVDPYGYGAIPKPLSVAAIKRISAREDHQSFAAVTDSIDTMLEPVVPESPTDSLRGSEERVETYMKRHERGEQLYHPQDNSQRIQIKCQH